MGNKQTKKKKFGKKSIRFYSIVAVLAIVFSLFYARTNVKHYLYDDTVDTADWSVTESADETYVLQEFEAQEDYITGVELQLTYAGNNEQGTLKAEVLNATGDSIGKGTTDFSKIKSGKLNTITFDEKIKLTKGSNYFIKLTQDSNKKGEGIAYSYANGDSKYQFKEASVTKNGSLVLRTLTKRFSVVTFIVCLFFILFIVVFLQFLFKLFRA